MAELLAVIAIIGILAAVVTLGVRKFLLDATEKACQTDIKSVEVAAQALKAKEGVTLTTTDDAKAKLVPTYLKQWPAPSDNKYNLTWTGGVTQSATGTVVSTGQPC